MILSLKGAGAMSVDAQSDAAATPGAAKTGSGLWRRVSQPHYSVVFIAVIAAGLLAYDRVAGLHESHEVAERNATALVENLALSLSLDLQSVISGIDETLSSLAEDLTNPDTPSPATGTSRSG